MTQNKEKLNKRYCLQCDEETQFIYIKKLRHSKCRKCGYRFAIHPNNPILIHFMEKNKSDTLKERQMKSYYKNKFEEKREECKSLMIKKNYKLHREYLKILESDLMSGDSLIEKFKEMFKEYIPK